jgi:hypothetical protein
MPLTRVVLFEKTSINEDGICLFLNGVEIFILTENEGLYPLNKKGQPEIFAGKKPTDYSNNTLVFLLVLNYPMESIKTESEIIWRLSKFVFRAKAYMDSVNGIIVGKKS